MTDLFMQWKARGLAVALLAVGTATGGAQTPAQPESPARPAGQAGPAATPNSNAPVNAVDAIRQGMGVDAPVDPNGYKIGIEDVLRVQVWRDPEVSGAMAVRPDGKITLQLIGEVQAAGLTPNELAKTIRDRLAEFLREPRVTVTIQQVLSKRYTVVGEVNKPGAVPLVSPTTILDALNNAGGLKEWANKKDIRVLRGSQRLRFNYKEVMDGKKMEQNIFLEPGDLIIVKD